MSTSSTLRLVTGFAIAALVMASCKSSTEDTTPSGDAACDNLDESSCLFPFPSDFFRKAGGPNGQAFHLDFGTSMPLSDDSEERMSPEPFEVHDGFPIVPAITFTLPGASLTGAPSLDDIGGSLKPESRTMIVDAETGALVPHWAELDYIAEDNGKRIIQLRVADALTHAHRYVVIVRGLVDDQGQPAPATPGFAALRDGTRTGIAGIEERRAHFDADVFPVIAKAGVPKNEVQLAWDFTTTTEQGSIGRLLAMRDRLYDAIGEAGPEYAIDNVIADPEGPEGTIATILEATAKIPSFMLPQETAKARRLRLDEAGVPKIEGFENVKFRVQIPRNALTGPDKIAVMQYGHRLSRQRRRGQQRLAPHLGEPRRVPDPLDGHARHDHVVRRGVVHAAPAGRDEHRAHRRGAAPGHHQSLRAAAPDEGALHQRAEDPEERRSALRSGAHLLPRQLAGRHDGQPRGAPLAGTSCAASSACPVSRSASSSRALRSGRSSTPPSHATTPTRTSSRR